MSARTSYLALALAWLCMWAAGVHAQDLQGVDYETAVSRALSANQSRDFATAKRYMEHAHGLEPSARTLRGLGIIAYGEGNAIAALHRFEAALAEQTKPLPESLRASVARLLIDVYALLGRYDVPVPPEAVLTVDARPAERDTQGRVLLTTGTHTLALMQGDTVRTLRVVTAGGELTKLQFPEGEPTAPPAASSEPKGRALGPQPERKDSLPQKGPRARNPLAISLAAGGMAVVGAAIGLAFVAHDRFDEAAKDCKGSDGCDDTSQQEAVYAEHHLPELTTAARVSAVVGSVMVGTAGVLWLTGVGKKKVRMGAAADAHSASLDVTLAF